MDRKSVLVTLADNNFIDQAKQLFSSVYWNAGWQGDYLLLAHNVVKSELIWFSEKGIIIKECDSLDKLELDSEYSQVVLDKFYLFTAEFKKWDNVVFLDADIIVFTSIDFLVNVETFSAATDMYYNQLKSQIQKPLTNQEFGLKYSLRSKVFNSGVFSFNTEIIKDNTFELLIGLSNKYLKFARYPDQLILNLYFYEKWKILPVVYNTYATFHDFRFPRFLKVPIIHFFARIKDDAGLFNPVWNHKNLYYSIWKKNLDNFDGIDLSTRENSQIYSRLQRWFNSFVLKTIIYKKRLGRILKRLIGRFGDFVKQRYKKSI
jgi:lipopolysaccharide biosynthesis glycosyltransferase